MARGNDSKAEKGFISVEDFIRTRDSVVTGLTSLTGGINTLITAYIGHTNQLLSGQGAVEAGLDTTQLTQFLSNAGLATAQAPLATGPLKKEKKKRVKKEKDPNAPKRPLTAFFLFSTQARDKVREDLDKPTPVEVNAEILRRWNAMDEATKQKWKDFYAKNNEQYKKDVIEYKAKTGQDITVEAPVDEEEDEVPDLEQMIAAEPVVSESDDSVSSDSEPEAPKPVPTPAKKKAVPKLKGKAASIAALNAQKATEERSPSPSNQLVETEIPLPGEAPSSSAPKRKKAGAKDSSPEEPKTKKARKGKAVEENKTEVAPPVADKANKKKKRKSEGF